MDRDPERVVVGAGLSGLYAALLLARAGRRVRLLERAARPGGLAASETFRGVPCDLGSHRLHPAALDLPLFREIHARAPFLTRPRRGVLVLGDRHAPYPPDALSMLRALGPRASLSMALGLLAAPRRQAFQGWERARAAADADDMGFERFVVDRVGRAAYAAFYRPYAEKVWGIDPAELSQTVAKKRVSTTTPLALLRARAARNENERRDVFLYPPGGVASIIAYLVDRLAELGVRPEPGRAFSAADFLGRAPVLYAGDLADLAPAARLEHRGLYLVYLALPIPRAGVAETYYCPDPRCWFGRVSELQHYSPALRNDGETILCVEIPEGAWGRGLDFASGARLAALLDQLARAGILPPGVRPLEIRQRFVPGVYPIYRRGWREPWRAAMQHLASLGVVPFGRQALFLHCNLDHCATIAADAVAHVESGGTPAAWVDHAERYLELRVRD